MNLSERSDDDLLSDVTKLVGSHRQLTARLVAHLAEIEERRLHLLLGFSSMFELCVKKLGFSEGEAFRRILAARLGRRFPVVHSLLASGTLNLSTLELLREWLTDENHEALFVASAGKSKREVQALLAARFPRPDRPSRIRRQASIEPLSEARFAIEFTASAELCRKLELCRDLMSHANPSRDLGVVIERAVDLLLVDLERKRLGKTKRPLGARRKQPKPTANGTDVARREATPASDANAMRRKAPSALVSSATRREVFARDGVQCTYVAGDGRRCEARAFLELDHVEPRAAGGANTADNLRVRCRAHNQLWAEQAFGRELVDRGRHFRQQKSNGGLVAQVVGRELVDRGGHLRWQTSARGGTEQAFECEMVEATRAAHLRQHRQQKRTAAPSRCSAPVFEKVRLALRGMGFRDVEARGAVAKVVEMHEADAPIELQEALREAILAATAA